jgi:iron complex transport system permease protein
MDAARSEAPTRPASRVPTMAPRVAGLAAALGGLALVGLLAGLAAGSEGWSLHWAAEWDLIAAIRAPRSLGALLTGALLGLAGAIAQGLFRNPLADPYLLGSAAGAGLGVVLVLAAGGALGQVIGLATAGWLLRLGLVGAAFVGALVGVALTLALARGTGRPLVLLLAGVVVGILMASLSELITLISPEALRGKQIFMLGTTSFLGWTSCAVLAAVLALAAPLAWRFARALDALVLGEASARSLGLQLAVGELLIAYSRSPARYKEPAAGVSDAELVAVSRAWLYDGAGRVYDVLGKEMTCTAKEHARCVPAAGRDR